MLVENDGYQTVTLVPSDNGNGEVSYVLVVQEDSKPSLVNIDIKVDQVNKFPFLYCSAVFLICEL